LIISDPNLLAGTTQDLSLFLYWAVLYVLTNVSEEDPEDGGETLILLITRESEK
jgi:hypothetical protein